LIFAGALGNGLDRIFRGYVIDFIETAFINFPVFNIADISITIGAIVLVIYVMFLEKD
ncbi:MAG: signal peptidase II, partial [Clostridia bacterium]|nr:signal peptidase II [Clostridia bacterium]